MARKHLAPRARARTPLGTLKPGQEICLELQDHSTIAKPAAEFFGLRGSADPQSQAARLTDQFLLLNRSIFELLQVSARRDYDGSDVFLLIQSGSAVGAVPLLSPLTAKPDFGLIVQPRFPWSGIGPMLAEMGWLVSPMPLRLPLLRRSERRVPPWVLSFMILARLKALLNQLERRFELIAETRSAPKGTVLWSQYATRELPRGNFLSVPCVFPDLRDDRQLKGAIRFTLEKQLRSLDTLREQGTFIHRLIVVAESLLLKVQSAPSRRPGSREMGNWMRRPLRTDTYVDGLQAIDWTVEDRGLAGLSDLEGVPWTMPMEQFFEAWVETVFRTVALRRGGILKTGRRRETVAPISWDPPFLASQKSLVPDLMLETEDTTFIIDAKYKRHFEELQQRSWHEQEVDLREQHRADLLQVLAYANLAAKERVICCLVYPCTMETWESLRDRGRLFHRAELPYRGRQIQVRLTALPMHAQVERIATPLIEEFRPAP
jgi:hypothetical protein